MCIYIYIYISTNCILCIIICIYIHIYIYTILIVCMYVYIYIYIYMHTIENTSQARIPQEIQSRTGIVPSLAPPSSHGCVRRGQLAQRESTQCCIPGQEILGTPFVWGRFTPEDKNRVWSPDGMQCKVRPGGVHAEEHIARVRLK